jgi:hypothetical protein
LKKTDISEVLVAFIIKAMNTRARLHGALSQKTANFILAAVIT